MIEWFDRLADVPGVNYTGYPGIQRPHLSSQHAQLKVITSTFDGKRHERLTWLTSDGEMSASPAKSHGFLMANDQSESTHLILKRMYEALELPGEATDYHFIIQGCIEELWSRHRRYQAPSLLEHIEHLCWLDIRLVEAQPDAIAFDHNGARRYFRVLAFEHLIRLYEREGFLHEALEVAQRAARFSPEATYSEQLRQRLDRIEAEDASGTTAV